MDLLDARVIGSGRAGGSLTVALRRAGWEVEGPLTRADPVADAARGCRFLVIAVGDPDIAAVARSVEPGDAVVVHLAGSLGVDVLGAHRRVGSLHPLVSMPDPETGADRLAGAWFAAAGEPAVAEIADAVGGRVFQVADDDRTRYHAVAAIAANHVVALLGQVERLAASIGVPRQAFMDLARGALDNAVAVGAPEALTGPVARGDWDTVRRHLEALPEHERPVYAALAEAARWLVEERVPA